MITHHPLPIDRNASGHCADAPDTLPETVCALGRQLGNCQLRRAGCSSLYDVLGHLYPPPAVLAELRSRHDIDTDVAQWLKRLDGLGVIHHEYDRRTNPNSRRG
jgi:hypothetical protein